MSYSFADNLENDCNGLDDDNNFDINVDKNLLDDWGIANTYLHSNLRTSKISENHSAVTEKRFMKLFIITLNMKYY